MDNLKNNGTLIKITKNIIAGFERLFKGSSSLLLMDNTDFIPSIK